MKKKIATILIGILCLSISLTACTKPTVDKDSQLDTNTSTTLTSETTSEYPPATSELPSHEETSDLSSIESEIESSKPESKPASSKPAPKPAAPAPKPKPPVSSAPVVAPTPPPATNTKHEEMRAVWISFLEFDSFRGSSESGFRQRIATYYDNSIAKDVNTVIVQVRPHGDSMYDSQYYPWSKHVSGTMGYSVDYDPVSIMVTEARARGLEVHAWINPYRTMTDTEFATVPDNFPTKMWYNSSSRDQYMVNIDGRWWLKPGNPEVVDLIVNGAKEIVANYNVDGVHIDDYFYGSDPKNYGDSKAQAKANTTHLVKSLYDGVKSVNASARFGVSPAGGFLKNNNLPNADLNYLSTDLALWCTQDGYIDYVLPQIYWGYDHKTQPFTMTLSKWENFVTADSVALYIGIAPSGLAVDIIHSQISDIKAGSRSSGYALYRYDYILGL